MSSDLVFRLFAPSGRYRVEVPRSASLKDLYKIVAEQCNFASPNEFVLYLEPSYKRHVHHSSSTRVGSEEAGLRDGQPLYIKVKTSPAASPNHSSSGPEISRKPSEAIIKSPESSAKSPTEGPRFKAFDLFLKERGYNTVDLPLKQNYCGSKLIRGQPNVIPSVVTLKHQPYRHVDHVELMNVQGMNSFVQFWKLDLDMQTQRAGWLFGYFKEDTHYSMGIRAVVEALYEPPQASIDSCPVFLEDPEYESVESIAACLGLELVGWVFTHLPREELLTSSEVKRIARLTRLSLQRAMTARMQLARIRSSHYTGYPVAPFVTVTVSPSDAQNVVTNAFMVSDLGMAFERDGLLAESPDPHRLMLREPAERELLPEILESGKPTTSFDPDWLIVRVNDSAPRQVRSIFYSWDFPVRNRAKEVTPSDIASFLRSSKKKDAPETFADFGLLLYIASLFDVATAAAVCAKVTAKEPIDPSLVETLMHLGS